MSLKTDGDVSSDDNQTDANYSATAANQQIVKYLDKNEGLKKKKQKCASLPQLSEISNCAASSSSSLLENSSNSKNNIIFSGRFFTIVKQLNCTEFQKKRKGILAECWTCKTRLQGSTQVTSNFIRHLRIKHPHMLKEYELIRGRIHSNKGTVQEQFNVLIVKLLVNNMLPIRLVEDKSFKDLIRFANDDLKVISIPTALRVIDKIFSSMVDKFKYAISKNKYFCTTADMWSINNLSFLGFTCHWLDESFQRKSIALSCKRFHGSHSYEQIKGIIQGIYLEYGLSCGNIVAAVTDNGANFLNEFNDFGIESNAICYSVDTDTDLLETPDKVELQSLEFKNLFLENVLPKRIRCATYTLNLIASTDVISILKQNSTIFTKHKDVMRKCSNLWSKVNKHKNAEHITFVLGSSLKYPVASRWNSLFDSIKDIILHKSKLDKLCKMLEIPQLFDEDFEYLEEYAQVISPIFEALDFLQRQNGLIYGYLLPTLATIRSKFRKIRINYTLKLLDLEILLKLDEALINRFQDYFNLTREAHDAIIASVLCPSVKLKWIPALNPSFNDGNIVQINALVRKAIEAEYDVHSASGIKKESPNEMSDVAYFDFFINEEQLQTASTSTSANTSVRHLAENEYLAYLANPSTSMDMLNRYPTLKTTFLRYNTPLHSSSAVERLFSFDGFINIPRREVLSDLIFEKMLLLKANNFGEL